MCQSWQLETCVVLSPNQLSLDGGGSYSDVQISGLLSGAGEYIGRRRFFEGPKWAHIVRERT